MYDDSSPVEAGLRTELDRYPELRLISFDVFDTVLPRMVGEPDSLFLLLGESWLARGLISRSPEQFARVRKEAERRARRFTPPPQDVTLVQIYDQLAHLWPATGAVLATLMESELEFEARYLRVVPGSRRLLDLAAAGGRTVVFVSDMYLPHDFIRGRLLHHGLATPDARVYVSSADGCSKSGGLLRRVLAEQQVAAEQALHIGDHPRSDLAAARAAGMRAILVTHTRLNRFEKLLEEGCFASGGATSLLAGASRMCRLGMDDGGTPAAFARVMAGVAGPVLWAFVLWLFGTAQRSGIQRLYFVSGSGGVLHAVARVANDGFGLGFDLRTLHLPPAHQPAGTSAVTRAIGDTDHGLEQRYLEASGFFDGVAMGLVDTDLAHSPLPRLYALRQALGQSLDGFLCMREASGWHGDLPRIHGFLYDADALCGDSKVANLAPLLELFTRAEEGAVAGYAEIDGVVRPVFDTLAPAKARSAARRLAALRRFAAEAVAHPDALVLGAGAPAAVNATLTSFWQEPTSDEATFWGMFEVGRASAPVWPSLTLADVWRAMGGNSGLRDGMPVWPKGSLHRSAPHIRVVIRLARAGRRWHARLRQLLRRVARLPGQATRERAVARSPLRSETLKHTD